MTIRKIANQGVPLQGAWEAPTKAMLHVSCPQCGESFRVPLPIEAAPALAPAAKKATTTTKPKKLQVRSKPQKRASAK